MISVMDRAVGMAWKCRDYSEQKYEGRCREEWLLVGVELAGDDDAGKEDVCQWILSPRPLWPHSWLMDSQAARIKMRAASRQQHFSVFQSFNLWQD